MFQPDAGRPSRKVRSIDSYLPLEYCRGNITNQKALAVFANTLCLYLVKDFALQVHPAASPYTEIDTDLLSHLPANFTAFNVFQLFEGIQQESVELTVTPTFIRVAVLSSY